LQGQKPFSKNTIPALDGAQISNEHVELDFQVEEPAEFDSKYNKTPSSQSSNSPKDGKEFDMPSGSPLMKSNKRRAPDSVSDGEVEVKATPQPKKIAMTGFKGAKNSAVKSTLNVGRALQEGIRSMISPVPITAIEPISAVTENSMMKIVEEHHRQATEDSALKSPEISTTKSQEDFTRNSAEESTAKPKPKSTINGASSLPKSWQFPQVLTSKQSPLVRTSGTIAKILVSDRAWQSLTAQQQLYLHNMLGNTNLEVSGDGKYPSPIPHLTSNLYKDAWQREVETVERDIKDGRVDPKWRAKADAAFEARLMGDLLDDAQKAAKQKRAGRQNGDTVNMNGSIEQDGEEPSLDSATVMKCVRPSTSPQLDSEEEGGDEEFTPNKRKSTAKRKLKPTASPKPKQARTSKGRKGSQSLVEEVSERKEEEVQKDMPQKLIGRTLMPKLSNDLDSTAYPSHLPVGIRRLSGEQ
jgi:hypothetical protein